jgi:uncharacterized protein DUF4252
MRLPILFALCLTLLAALPLAAAPQTPLAELPGYIPISALGLFAHQAVSVEVNLSGPLLELVGAATREDDPEFSKVLADLRGIQVRVVELKGSASKSSEVRGQLAEAARWLEAHGWTVSVKVNKDAEDDSIYTLIRGQSIVGLAVLHFEVGREAALVNIVGHIDPSQVGRLGRHLDLPVLEHAPLAKPAQP